MQRISPTSLHNLWLKSPSPGKTNYFRLTPLFPDIYSFLSLSSLDISDAYIACPNEPQGCTFRSAQMLVLAHWQDHCTFGSLQKPKANPLKNKFSNYMVNHYIREEQGRDDNK